MSFGQRTPESFLKRSDSKDPATTCKGITATGRSCRRALAAGDRDSPAPSPSKDGNGVLAVLDAGDAAAFFCWQHKDQAEMLVSQLQERSRILPLKQRSSIDTLIERVGILDLEEDANESPIPARRTREEERNRHRQKAVKKRDALPQEWQHIQGPLMSVPEELVDTEALAPPRSSRPRQRQRRYPSKPVRRSNVKASWSCCVRADDEEDLPPARRRRRQSERPDTRLQSHDRVTPWRDQGINRPQSFQTPPVRRPPPSTTEIPMRQCVPPRARYEQHPNSSFQGSTPARPPLQPHHSTSPPNSRTATFLSLIPPHLSPSTTSALLAELSRPISEADEEGYIYIYWLTPELELSRPDDETVSSLLESDTPSFPSSSHEATVHGDTFRQQIRAAKAASALQRFASVKHHPTESRKILLKIGRAVNVHRRLTQWTKQCGQNITLIRYYPYQSRSTDDSAWSSERQKKTVPHVHRVERLIQLELADMRVTNKQECEACGRVHKEWFEVDATKEGICSVDEVVRRWVSWAETHGASRPRD